MMLYMQQPTLRRTSVAAVIRAEMGFHDVSRKALSVATGIPIDTLRRRLHGIQPFTIEELDAICVSMGLEVEDVLRNARERGDAA